MEAIIETLLRESVRLHEILHGFHVGRGMGTEILELRLAHELASVDQDPLLLVFLDLHKAYLTVDCDHLLTTLEGYGAGTHMCRLLEMFWYQQEVVTHQNGYHSPHFRETRGTTKDILIFPTLFNFIVTNVVRNWLAMMVEDQLVAQEGLGLSAGRCMGLLYADK